MSAAELALAARKLRVTADRLGVPESVVVSEWDALMAMVNGARSAGGGVELALIEFQRDLEARLAARLLHAPLESTPGERR